MTSSDTAPSFSGLGHRPFTAAARVRIPLGSPAPLQDSTEAAPAPITTEHRVRCVTAASLAL
ncbi:hypothetical protein FRIGORI9N_40020 [Frigoribacterium sp. 9N]|nr:hypothetical protein FRIGORI9N_40020 [Frigoribacterium sp. 9N]